MSDNIKSILKEIKQIIMFCGFEVLSIKQIKKPRANFLIVETQSKGRFRKKNYFVGISDGLNGLLAAEREFARRGSKGGQFLIIDTNNSLPSTSFKAVKLIHTYEELQEELQSK